LKNFESAGENFGYNKLVIAGGVSANSKLRYEADRLCKKHGWSLYLPEMKYCGDNAAMIASQGYFEYLKGVTATESLNAYATMPLDDLHY
jgi:N6-L-threonylcarbamoyladenine synthase